MTRPLDFRWADRVNQQVCVTVDQPGQQSHGAEIDGLDPRRRVTLHLRRRTNLFDFPFFNQHGCGRKHIARARIEEAASS